MVEMLTWSLRKKEMTGLVNDPRTMMSKTTSAMTAAITVDDSRSAKVGSFPAAEGAKLYMTRATLTAPRSIPAQTMTPMSPHVSFRRFHRF